MNIFEFNDYPLYLRKYIKAQPRHGRGLISKMALAMNSNTTLLSQVFAGTRHLNQEQAILLSEFIGHTDLEREYFFSLIYFARAGSVKLRNYYQEKLQLLKEEALKLSKRISHEKKLSDTSRAIFYSNWLYSAIHLFCSTAVTGVSLEEISSRFNTSKKKTAEIVQFLISTGLIYEENNRYKMGTKSTFVERGSPFLYKHHSNWRIKAIQKSDDLTDQELMYTGQFSISINDFNHLREELVELVKRINATVKDSPAEEIINFNLDWFKI